MGKSFIYNVFGLSVVHQEDGDAQRHSDVYPCMTKLDMVRARKKAEKKGQPIESWQAQTRQGERMVGGTGLWLDSEINLSRIKTVECPRCKGEGCGICDFSGISTKRDLSHYMPWQLEPEK